MDIERLLLAALPSLRPQLGERTISRKVDKLSCVRFGSARYSVPNRLIGTTVLLSVAARQVRVLEPFTGRAGGDQRRRRPLRLGPPGQAAPGAAGQDRH